MTVFFVRINGVVVSSKKHFLKVATPGNMCQVICKDFNIVDAYHHLSEGVSCSNMEGVHKCRGISSVT